MGVLRKFMSNVIRLKNKPSQIRTDDLLSSDSQSDKPIRDLEAERELELRNKLEKQYSDGFEAGLKEGKEEGFREAKQNIEIKYEALLTEVSKDYATILQALDTKLQEYEESFAHLVATLSMRIAEKIIYHEINERPNIENLLKEAASKIIGANKVLIRMHPEEIGRLKQAGVTTEYDEKRVQFETSERVSRGGVMIESEIGNVDATVETRLTELFKLIGQLYKPGEE